MDHHRTDTACRVCGAPVAPDYALCFCCATLVRQLKMPLAPVVAVAEFHPGDPLHRRLRGYKDEPVAEGRAARAARLAAMLGVWLTTGVGRRWTTTVAEWDVAVTVPSSCRPAGDPMADIVRAIPSLAGRHRPVLERGPAPMGHLRADRQGFAVRPGLAGGCGARPSWSSTTAW